jgi:hypothetical protein
MNSHNNSRKNQHAGFKSTRLLDQLREQIRYLHYSLRTEGTYVSGEENSFIFITSCIRET